MTPRENTDPLFPPPPPAKEEVSPKDPVRLKSGYVPDNLKVQTAQTKGEPTAAYQGKPFTPQAGEDTQPPVPAVVIDETHKEGIPGDVIRRLAAKLDDERRRGETTQTIDTFRSPKKNKNRLIVGALVAVAAAVVVAALFVTMNSRTQPPIVEATSTAATGSIAVPIVPTVIPPANTIGSAADTDTLPTTDRPTTPVATTSITGKAASRSTAPRASSSAPSASHHPSDWPGQQL